MTRPLLFVAALAALAVPARAQIVVTRATVEALLGTSRTTATAESDTTAPVRAALQALVDRTGAGQTWDASALAFTAGYTLAYTPVAPPQPGSDDPHFADATHIVRTDSPEGAFPSGYGYYRLTDTELVALGSGGGGFVLRHVPGIVQPLPYTFGSAWAGETEVVFDPPAFPGRQTVREETEVVGWGTLVTAAGAEPALMLRSLLVSRFILEVPGSPPAETVDSLHSAVYYTGGPTTLVVSLDRAGAALRADLSLDGGAVAGEPPPAGGAGGPSVRVAGPNPARRGSAVEVRVETAGVPGAELAVFDVLGRRVAALDAGPDGRAVWETAGLPAGLYIIRLQAGADAVVQRVVLSN